MPQDDDDSEPRLGATVELDGHAVLVGTCSWTDRTLTRETEWYPRRTMSAEQRLHFYAARFPLVEVDSTHYRPLTAGRAAAWAERSPQGFRFNVKAYSLLTGHPTQPRSLWPDLRELLDEQAREKRSIHATHLPAGAVDEAWRRLHAALEPLRASGKLGPVLVQYPHWAGSRRETRRELEALPGRLPGTRICVEFRSPRWLAERADRERTLARLAELGLALVCVDAPHASGLPWLLAATSERLAVVRFHGRDDAAWANTGGGAAERFRYDYSDAELGELTGPLAQLAAEARETHLLMNNCYRDHAVRNAARLRDLLSARGR